MHNGIKRLRNQFFHCNGNHELYVCSAALEMNNGGFLWEIGNKNDLQLFVSFGFIVLFFSLIMVATEN